MSGAVSLSASIEGVEEPLGISSKLVLLDDPLRSPVVTAGGGDLVAGLVGKGMQALGSVVADATGGLVDLGGPPPASIPFDAEQRLAAHEEGASAASRWESFSAAEGAVASTSGWSAPPQQGRPRGEGRRRSERVGEPRRRLGARGRQRAGRAAREGEPRRGSRAHAGDGPRRRVQRGSAAPASPVRARRLRHPLREALPRATAARCHDGREGRATAEARRGISSGWKVTRSRPWIASSR